MKLHKYSVTFSYIYCDVLTSTCLELNRRASKFQKISNVDVGCGIESQIILEHTIELSREGIGQSYISEESNCSTTTVLRLIPVEPVP